MWAVSDLQRVNFYRVSQFLLEEIPRILRELFRHRWNSRFGNVHPWTSGPASGSFLMENCPSLLKKDALIKKVFAQGDEKHFDVSSLCFLLEPEPRTPSRSDPSRHFHPPAVPGACYFGPLNLDGLRSGEAHALSTQLLGAQGFTRDVGPRAVRVSQ